MLIFGLFFVVRVLGAPPLFNIPQDKRDLILHNVSVHTIQFKYLSISKRS